MLREIFVENASNIDWEDIEKDDTYIYVGDFGNNQGSRADLRIYRILIEEFIENDTVQADTINFNYSNQTDFTPNTFTNFDAETLISRGDSLYIFSKNWGNFKSYIYSMPKVPGNYSIQKVNEIEPMGLITGGSHIFGDRVILTGYGLGPFIVELELNSDDFTDLEYNRYDIDPEGSLQVEAICEKEEHMYFISSEKLSSGEDGVLSLLSSPGFVGVKGLEKSHIKLSPNPFDDTLKVDVEGFISCSIVNSSTGEVVLTSEKASIDTSALASGNYIITVITEKAKFSRKIIKE